MSGQQEPRGRLDRSDQLDPRDSTLDLSGLISRLNSGTQNNGSLSNGSNSRSNGGQDNGAGAGNNALAGNSGVNGTGDTVPYVRPPQRAPAEHDDAQPPPAPVPPVSAVHGAHAAVTVRPEPSGANGHGALASYGAYATQDTEVGLRHSRTTPHAAPLAQPDALAPPEATVEPDAAVEAEIRQPEQEVRPGRPERPPSGSLADLRQRLERLPYGHPSSPYHVDGERKPPPYRLKHLELAPPTPSRITQAHNQPAIVDDDPISAATTPDSPIEATAPAAQPQDAPSPGPAILTEDQLRIADDAYDRFRAAEGRNLFGSYGSSGLTAMIREVAAGLEYGELAPNTEQNALLEPEAFNARFAAMLARYPDRSAELLARRIPGAISYSFVFDAERYSAGIWMVQDALTAVGFELLARRNDWNHAANRCVATMWHDPTSGLPFEVQFHTTASLDAQQLARSSASLISDPRIPSADAAGLQSDLAAAWAALPAPPGHGQIGDYRRQGGGPPAGSAAGA